MKEQNNKEKSYSIVFVRGVEGPSIYLNDTRICGTKPWGGGDVIFKSTTTIKDLIRAIPELRKLEIT